MTAISIQQAPDSTGIRAALALAEHCVTAVSTALLEAQPDLFERAARDLQQAAQALSVALHGNTNLERELVERLGKLRWTMATQREACVRRSAVVERSLHSIIPAMRPSTYSAGSMPYPRRPGPGAATPARFGK